MHPAHVSAVMTDPTALPQSLERRCPACLGEQIAPLGRVMAANGLIHVEHRCAVCRTGFFLVRKLND
jgi:hypothetical protein